MLIPSSCLKLLCDVMAHPGFAAICSSGVANRKTAEAFLYAVRMDEYFQLKKKEGRLKKIHDSVP